MQLPAADSLTKLDDRELLRDLYGLAAFGRRVVVRLLEFLNEVEARRLHLLEGCPSMFELCRRLGFSEGETLRRLAAARLMKRHPAVREELTTGRVHLTGLYMIHKYVTSENVESLLVRIRGKTKDEVEDLLIELDPKRAKARAEVPSQMRRIPSSLVATRSTETERETEPPLLALARSGPSSPPFPAGPPMPPPPVVAPALGLALEPQDFPSPPAVAPASPATPTLTACSGPRAPATDRGSMPPAPPPKTTPAGDRWAVAFTGSQKLHDDIERLKMLMAHDNPTGDIALIVERAVALLLAKVEKERLGKTDKPRQRSASAAPSESAGVERSTQRARIPNETKRVVVERDGWRCSFVGQNGERCTACRRLQFDHVVPLALGGGSGPENCRLLCASHNLYEAERVFGRDFVAARVRSRRERQSAKRSRAGGAD